MGRLLKHPELKPVRDLLRRRNIKVEYCDMIVHTKVPYIRLRLDSVLCNEDREKLSKLPQVLGMFHHEQGSNTRWVGGYGGFSVIKVKSETYVKHVTIKRIKEYKAAKRKQTKWLRLEERIFPITFRLVYPKSISKEYINRCITAGELEERIFYRVRLKERGKRYWPFQLRELKQL